MRLHRRDPVLASTPAGPAAQETRGSSILRTLRTAWWPRFLVAGVILTVVGVTLLSGTAQAVVALGEQWSSSLPQREDCSESPGTKTADASPRFHRAAGHPSRISNSAANGSWQGKSVRPGVRRSACRRKRGWPPRTRRRTICDSRNLSRPSVTAGQPHRESCVVHVHAKTALTEPVRHQCPAAIRFGGGAWDMTGRGHVAGDRSETGTRASASEPSRPGTGQMRSRETPHAGRSPYHLHASCIAPAHARVAVL